MKDIVLYLGYYSPLIRKQQNYKMKAIKYYLTGTNNFKKFNQKGGKNRENTEKI